VAHFRVFPQATCKKRYRGGRAPPLSMVSVVEGHESADDNYENLLQSQLIWLFDTLMTISVPSVSSNLRAEDFQSASSEKGSRHARSKSISARHKMGVLKEIAQQQAAAEAAAGSKEDSKQNEATVKRFARKKEMSFFLSY
jgi:hypothetical protein